MTPNYEDALHHAQREAAIAKQQRDSIKRRMNRLMRGQGIEPPAAKAKPRAKIVKQDLGEKDFKHLPKDVRKWLKAQASADVTLIDVVCGIIKDAHYEEVEASRARRGEVSA